MRKKPMPKRVRPFQIGGINHPQSNKKLEEHLRDLKRTWNYGKEPSVPVAESSKSKETTGSCVYCGGKVVPKYPPMSDANLPDVLGIELFDGFFCKKCGLRYEFCPGSGDIDGGAVDHEPENLYDDADPDYEIVDPDE